MADSGFRVSLHHVPTSYQELSKDMTAQQLSLYPFPQALARQDWLLVWAWGPEKGLDTRLQRTRMRDPIKAELQSEAIIGLRLLLPREGTIGLVRDSGYRHELPDKSWGPTASGELPVGK